MRFSCWSCSEKFEDLPETQRCESCGASEYLERDTGETAVCASCSEDYLWFDRELCPSPDCSSFLCPSCDKTGCLRCVRCFEELLSQ
jgi:hypothetical protein